MISVCCPTWNRQDAVDGMFRHYAELYPRLPLEFSVCDDGSIPPADVPLDAWGWPTILTALPPKAHALNPCVPINRAVEASSGEIVVISNPEVRHDGRVFVELLSLLEQENDYVTARCYGRGYRANEEADPFWLAGPGVDYRTNGRYPVPPGAHFHFLAACRRSLWDRAGGFDEDYRNVQGCDDNDWLWRLHRAGARFRVTEGAVWQPKSETRWNLPPGGELFLRKWPEVRELL